MTEETKEEEKTEVENLPEKVNDIELANLEKKRNELKEIEERVDKKTAQLKAIISETEMHGKGFGALKKQAETPKEYAERVMRGEVEQKN